MPNQKSKRRAWIETEKKHSWEAKREKEIRQRDLVKCMNVSIEMNVDSWQIEHETMSDVKLERDRKWLKTSALDPHPLWAQNLWLCKPVRAS